LSSVWQRISGAETIQIHAIGVFVLRAAVDRHCRLRAVEAEQEVMGVVESNSSRMNRVLIATAASFIATAANAQPLTPDTTCRDINTINEAFIANVGRNGSAEWGQIGRST
jgi:hypothetical protein